MNNKTYQSAEEKLTDAAQVARRSLVMAAVVCRGVIDDNADQNEAAVLYNRMLDWLTQFALWDAVEPSEEKILHTSVGKLEQQDMIRAGWYAAGLAILAWALQQFEFPRHDQEVDPPDVAESVGFLSEDVEALVRTAQLRSRMELKACRELLYAIHARLRDYLRNKGRKDFTGWIEKTWLDMLKLDAAYLIADDDLAIDGKPISEVEERRVRACEWIIGERHRAIIWLVEGYPSYSQTPVDT